MPRISNSQESESSLLASSYLDMNFLELSCWFAIRVPWLQVFGVELWLSFPTDIVGPFQVSLFVDQYYETA